MFVQFLSFVTPRRFLDDAALNKRVVNGLLMGWNAPRGCDFMATKIAAIKGACSISVTSSLAPTYVWV